MNESALQKHRSSGDRRRGRGGRADRAPRALTWLVNAAARKIPGIRGKVRRMQINFLAPGVTLSGVSVATLYTPGHRIEVGVIALNSQWKDLLRGALVASLRVEAPRFLFNAAGIRGSPQATAKPRKPHRQILHFWQEKMSRLPRFKIASMLSDRWRNPRRRSAWRKECGGRGRSPESARGKHHQQH